MAQWQPLPNVVRLNRHGILGAVLIVSAVVVATFLSWRIPWIYAIGSVLLYVGFVTYAVKDVGHFGGPGSRRATESDAEYGDRMGGRYLVYLQLLYSAHLSFFFLILGMLIRFDNFWIGLFVFVGAIACGCAIPLLLLKRA